MREVEGAAQRGKVKPGSRTKFQVVALLAREERARVKDDDTITEGQRADMLKRLDLPVEPVAPIRTPQAPAGSRLTPRELEILTLITGGLTNGEIGEELGLSINSIKTYIRQAYRKIDVERRTQAVAWGMANGLVADAEPVAV